MIGFRFKEEMAGTVQRAGERFDRPFRIDFDVRAPSALGVMVGETVGEAIGHVRLDGLAKDAPARGTIALSPFRKFRIRYRFEFTGDDGATYRFDGWKTTTPQRHLHGWSSLPGKIYDARGEVWGDAHLRFDFRAQLGDWLRSIRFPRAAT